MKKRVIAVICIILMAAISVNLIGCDLGSSKKSGKKRSDGGKEGGDDPVLNEEAINAFHDFLDAAHFVEGMSQSEFINQMSRYRYEGSSINEIIEGMHYDGPYGGGYQASCDGFGYSNDYIASEDGTFANYKNSLSTRVQLEGLTLPNGINFSDSLGAVMQKLGTPFDIKKDFRADYDDASSMTLYNVGGVSLKITNCLLGAGESGKPLYDYELTYLEEYSVTRADGRLAVVTRCARLSFTDENKLGQVNISVNERILLAHSAADNSTVVTDFAIRLFKYSNEAEKNTLISPISVLCALAMTANGAEGDTREEMESVLGMSIDDYNIYLYAYLNSLPQGAKYKLNLANSIWFKDDASLSVNSDFLQINKDFYGADIRKESFDERTVNNINNWVSNRTDGMITQLLDKIPTDAVMYLINALAFDAEWAVKYDENDVYIGEFTNEDGAVTEVEMMRGDDGLYIEDELATGFIKYYSGHKYAFVALLPDEGTSVEDYIETLDGERLQSMLANGRDDVLLITSMPKFSVEYDVEMSEILSEMGMPTAFSSGMADFSGLGTSDIGNIYISSVIHKTFIEIAEQGTRAGAVTSVEMNEEGMAPEEVKNVHLDRPFVYMLIDCENNIPFFIGALMDVE